MGLSPILLKGVEKMGFKHPFPIQEAAIGPLLEGKDVIGQAKTGSGKTAAFSLPILQGVDTGVRRVQALVLAPTRELAVQITEEMRRLGEYSGARVTTIYGGQSINVQREALRHGTQVVVGTPGRVIDHLERGWLDLDSVRFAVLDEADTMLDMGFIDAVEFILGRTPEDKQMCLFSATMPGRVTELAKRFMRSPVKVMVDTDKTTVETLDQFFASVEQRGKLELLSELLQKEKPTSAIVFCRTKHGAHRLAGELEKRGFYAVPLHGNLSQHQRDYHMDVFRSGHVDIMVATDLASRGIDISQVECVVNFDVPQDPLQYFHRVGRTARAGRPGRAFTFVSGEESEDFLRILRMSKAPISPLRPEDKVTEPFGVSRRRDRRGGSDRRKRYGRKKPNWRRRRYRN